MESIDGNDPRMDIAVDAIIHSQIEQESIPGTTAATTGSPDGPDGIEFGKQPARGRIAHLPVSTDQTDTIGSVRQHVSRQLADVVGTIDVAASRDPSCQRMDGRYSVDPIVAEVARTQSSSEQSVAWEYPRIGMRSIGSSAYHRRGLSPSDLFLSAMQMWMKKIKLTFHFS